MGERAREIVLSKEPERLEPSIDAAVAVCTAVMMEDALVIGALCCVLGSWRVRSSPRYAYALGNLASSRGIPGRVRVSDAL